MNKEVEKLLKKIEFLKLYVKIAKKDILNLEKQLEERNSEIERLKKRWLLVI